MKTVREHIADAAECPINKEISEVKTMWYAIVFTLKQILKENYKKHLVFRRSSNNIMDVWRPVTAYDCPFDNAKAERF
jgi:hypothetical protein